MSSSRPVLRAFTPPFHNPVRSGRWCVGALLVALAACGAKDAPPAGGAAGKAPPPATVGVVTVAEQAVALQTELPGRVSPVRVAQVRARVSGVVLKRLFREGSEVKAGQVLYEIDAAAYRATLDSAQASMAKAQGGVAVDTLAIGQVANQPKPLMSGCSAQAANTHAPGQTTPSMAKGVTTKVTQGIANKLANKPTKDTWPKNSSVNGAKAQVIAACSRNKPQAPRSKATPQIGNSSAPHRCLMVFGTKSVRNSSVSRSTIPAGGVRSCALCWPEAINTPTATKLSQNPGCNKAHGSSVNTTAPANSQMSGPCH